MKKFILLLILLFPVMLNASVSEEYQYDLYRAKVIEMNEQVITNKDETRTVQEAKIKIMNRDKKGEEAIITNSLTGNELYDMNLKTGSIITVHFENDNFYFIGYDNLRPMLFLGALFLFFLILIGGIKGLKALFALSITLSLILFLMVPMLLRGTSPILASILVCALSTVITFYIISGFNRKSISATVGTIGGLLIGGFVAYVFGVLTRLTGFSSNDATQLLYIPDAIKFDFRGLLFAGIIIGALGACMDVSISIASSLTELKKENPNMDIKNLIKAGFNVGHDVMGTMINTLVLAYAGGTLTTLIVFAGFQTKLYHIVNLDFVATEIVRAMAGSIGLLFAIPFTIFMFVLFPWKRVNL